MDLEVLFEVSLQSARLGAERTNELMLVLAVQGFVLKRKELITVMVKIFLQFVF